MRKRLQNRIAGSRWALPVCTVYAVAISLIAEANHDSMWLQLGMVGLATLLMVELNNSNALIRIYSRMVSCSFLALTMMTPQIMRSFEGCIVSICTVAFYIAICKAYQNKTATGSVFYAFVAIGAASMAWVHYLLFVPLLWLLLATNILAIGWRTFWASVIGLLLPYWFQISYLLYQGDIMPMVNHLAQLSDFGKPLALQIFDIHETASLVFLALLTITGSIHFVRTSFKDKIRTRMIYEMFIVMAFASMAFILLQPQHAIMTTRILITSTAPLIGHFIALTTTRTTNYSTLAIIFATLAITSFNLWMQ